MIERKEYIDKFLSWKDKELVKIITGIRRCGKSTLFKLYQEKLLKLGIKKKQILNYNLESPENENLLKDYNLYYDIKSKLIKNKVNYIFLDEIQNLNNWEKTIRGLFDIGNFKVDIYLTGSNSQLLNEDWSEKLTGRNIEIHILPLSLKEYYFNLLKKIKKITLNKLDNNILNNYVKYSSFPYVFNFLVKKNNENQINDYLSNIYKDIFYKDIIKHNNIKNVNQLEMVLKYIIDNIGNEISPNKISNTLKTNNRITIHPSTIENYIQYFCDSYILYKVNRYDIKGKQILKTLNKYYLVDVTFKNVLSTSKNYTDNGKILENIVYLELIRRNYKVYIGKFDIYDKKSKQKKNVEVDFVAIKNNIIEYYQVAETTKGEETLQRELRPLNEIRDNYSKFILTMDNDNTNYNGIQKINIMQWLLDK